MSTPVFTAVRASLGALDFNATEASGVLWVVEDIQGWGSPKPTLSVTQKPRAHGGVASESFLTSRSIVLSGTVVAPDGPSLSDALDRLNAAVTLAPSTLTVWESGRTRFVSVQRQDEVIVSQIGANAATWSVQLIAVDPRKYGAPVTVTTNMPSQTGGLTYPITYPIVYAATVVSGTVSITNPGNIAAPVTLRVDLPSVGAIITHIGQATTTFALAPITDDFVTIDMARLEVLGNGQVGAARNGYILTPNAQFSLDPGLNTFAFNGQTYNSSAVLTVTSAQGAWL